MICLLLPSLVLPCSVSIPHLLTDNHEPLYGLRDKSRKLRYILTERHMNDKKEILDKLRLQIDATDLIVLKALAKRMKITEQIGTYKQAHKLETIDRRRQQEVIGSRITIGKKLDLPEALVRALFKHIHQHSVSLQNKIRL